MRTGLTPNVFGGMDFTSESEVTLFDPDGLFSHVIPVGGQSIAEHCAEAPRDCGTYRLKGGSWFSDASEIEMRSVVDDYGVIETETVSFAKDGEDLLLDEGSYNRLPPFPDGTTFDGSWTYLWASSGMTATSSGSFATQRTLVMRADGTFSRDGWAGGGTSSDMGGVNVSSGRPGNAGSYHVSGYELVLSGDDGSKEILSLITPDIGSDKSSSSTGPIILGTTTSHRQRKREAEPPFERSKRDVIIHAARLEGGGIGGWATSAATTATIVDLTPPEAAAAIVGAAETTIAATGAFTLAAPIKQGQVGIEALQHHFGGIFVLAGLVLPFAGLQLAFDIDLAALFQIALSHAGEAFREDHHAVPLGLFTLFTAIAVLPALGSGDGEVHHLAAAGQVAHFGIGPQIADEDDLIDTARHDDFLPLSSPGGLRETDFHCGAMPRPSAIPRRLEASIHAECSTLAVPSLRAPHNAHVVNRRVRPIPSCNRILLCSSFTISVNVTLALPCKRFSAPY